MNVVFEIDTTAGRWRGLVGGKGLSALDPVTSARDVVPPGARRDDSHPAAVELREYFAGTRREFTVPVDLSGVAPFTREVLTALLRVPYGATTTYGALAREVGRPRAARAVGQAVGANPVPVVVPCHRVLAADRRLGGFSGGLDMKRALLRIEGVAWK